MEPKFLGWHLRQFLEYPLVRRRQALALDPRTVVKTQQVLSWVECPPPALRT
jgi:hypothetical protein